MHIPVKTRYLFINLFTAWKPAAGERLTSAQTFSFMNQNMKKKIEIQK